MTTTKPLPRLSEETILALKTLRAENKEAFYSYVKALRVEGWSLKAIGDACDVSKTAASNWERAWRPSFSPILPEVEPLPKAPTKTRTPRTEKVELTPNESQELRDLTLSASKVRRYTDAHSESRKAAERLEELLEEYISAGVTVTDVAKACGVSRSAIAQRRRKEKN